ncbi:hypothetical protein [Polaromonas sp. YR568]|uniref:hypothetical protein n=1 Tax=Polaromonas sp. YR568 TaxID=1855301 RepID=UPI003137D862
MNNKQVKVYTFTIPANGAFPLLVISDYFRIQSATGAVDVNGDTFGTLPDLLTGQGLENTPYNRLTFVDKSGAPNTVSVLCSGDLFIDNRLYGVVTISGDISLAAATLSAVTDTPKARTLANVAFQGGRVQAAGANASVVQLWNPTAGQRLVVRNITASVGSNASIELFASTAAIAGVATYAVNKNLGGALSLAELRSLANAAVAGTVLATRRLLGNTTEAFDLLEPIVLAQNSGLCVATTGSGINLEADFEFYTEAV